MANAPFFNLFEQYQSLLNPVVKANKLAVANLEKLVSFQFNALQSYADLGLDRLKAAAGINDPYSLQAFVSGQLEAANVVHQKLLEDAKVLTDLTAGFTAEFGKLARNEVAEFGDQTAKAADQAVKASKEATDKVAKVSKTA